MATPAEVRAFLDANAALTLACVDEDGPWAADVYYVRDGRDLLYLSSPESRHARALARDPRAAATVHGEATSWKEIRGVQLDGEVAEVEGKAATARLLTLYLAKFPFAEGLLKAAGAALRKKVRLYRLTPRTLWFVDNAAGLTGRAEVDW